MPLHTHSFPDFKVEEKKPIAEGPDLVAMVKKDGSCVILNNVGTKEEPDLRAFSRTKREIPWMRPWCRQMAQAGAMPELIDPKLFAVGELELHQEGKWSHQMKHQLGALLSAPDFNAFFARKGMQGVGATYSMFDLGHMHQVFGKQVGSLESDLLIKRLERLQTYRDNGTIDKLNQALIGTPLQIEVCPWQIVPAAQLAKMDINNLAKANEGRIPFLDTMGEGIVYCPVDGNQRSKLKGEITIDVQVLACCSAPPTAKKPQPTLGWIVEEAKTGALFCAFGGIREDIWSDGPGQQVELKLLHVKSIDYNQPDKLLKSLQGGNPTFLSFRYDRPAHVTKTTAEQLANFAHEQGVRLDRPVLSPEVDN